MKRAMKLLARFYPSGWRKRYGAEFDALLDDTTPSAHHTFDVLRGALKMQMIIWSFGRITFACSLTGMLVAAALSFALPSHYLSQATLTVTPADESTRGLANNAMEGSIFNRQVLASLIQDHNLYPRERARMPLDDVIDKMKRSIQAISVLPASPENRGTLTFAIQFDYPDPHVAQRIDEELLTRLIEANLHAQPDSHTTFYVPAPPSLPVWPAAPSRTRFAAIGLCAGLFAGLALVGVIKSRSSTTA
jgi:uncharacterized protein involved in exopolysaccharide biosynthesis